MIFPFFSVYKSAAFPEASIGLFRFITSHFLHISRIPKVAKKNCEKQLKTERCLYWSHLCNSVVIYDCISAGRWKYSAKWESIVDIGII